MASQLLLLKFLFYVYYNYWRCLLSVYTQICSNYADSCHKLLLTMSSTIDNTLHLPTDGMSSQTHFFVTIAYYKCDYFLNYLGWLLSDCLEPHENVESISSCSRIYINTSHFHNFQDTNTVNNGLRKLPVYDLFCGLQKPRRTSEKWYRIELQVSIYDLLFEIFRNFMHARSSDISAGTYEQRPSTFGRRYATSANKIICIQLRANMPWSEFIWTSKNAHYWLQYQRK